MRYISTRDKNNHVSGAQAIATGISSEGGLFVPEYFPSLREEIDTMVDSDYQDIARMVFEKFLPEFEPQELIQAIEAAYGTGFDDPRIAPVIRITPTIYIQELWHGPTSAFKDMALQMLPQLLTLSLQKVAKGKEAVLLVATSGDTGKAALEGFADVAGTRMLVFYPDGGVSQIQELQMATQEGENVEVFAVEGNFDDTQTAVKQIFTNPHLKEELAEKNMLFSSANSINWGRLMPQIVYYFSAYVDLIKSDEILMGDKINICVPTGNFGNILAAYYAKQMGLPVNKFICASNENNVLTQFINTGIYDRKREFHLTNSPSMDILISSNLERLLFELSGRNDVEVSTYMKELVENGSYTVRPEMLDTLQQNFYGGYVTEEQTLENIKDLFAEFEYLCDTHTAVALGVYREYQEKTGDETKTVIASTANPYKFAESVLYAIDSTTENTDPFETLEQLEQRSGLTIPVQIKELQGKPSRFSTTISREEMESTVRRSLGL